MPAETKPQRTRKAPAKKAAPKVVQGSVNLDASGGAADSVAQPSPAAEAAAQRTVKGRRQTMRKFKEGLAKDASAESKVTEPMGNARRLETYSSKYHTSQTATWVTKQGRQEAVQHPVTPKQFKRLLANADDKERKLNS